MVVRVTSLHAYLGSKEVINRSAPLIARIGALECLASLYLTNGRGLGSTVAETVSGAIKLIGRCASSLQGFEAPKSVSCITLCC